MVSRVLYRTFLLFVSVLFVTSSAVAALDAVEMVHVPIELNLGCERQFLKSSQNRKDTVYVVPNIIPDTDIRETIFH